MSTPHMINGQGLARPQTLHGTKSFSRMDSSQQKPLTRSRASTLQNGTISNIRASERLSTPAVEGSSHLQTGDIFEPESAHLLLGSDGNGSLAEKIKDLPEDFDDLPIELISMTDRFIESLTAKVHSEPPSIEKLSDMFQDFYLKAETHISTHISALSTKQHREASPNPLVSSKGSGSRLRSMSSKDIVETPSSAPEQQMLTPQEISDRRKARRLLEHKRLALEEAVEKRICERAYKRIWRHRSTLDEVRDEKLRSRTAALALIGIGLRDLGIEVSAPTSPESGNNDAGTSIDNRVEQRLHPARQGLLRMNEAKSPLGKLQHLAAAHKSIVDFLSNLHQSSSSADEILPTLIYTLITSPPEGINVISNLHFTQRFRAASKIDGEAAYCLVNLEAAISFLETVDLASLRSNEPLGGPPKSSSRPSTPRAQVGLDMAAGSSIGPLKSEGSVPDPKPTSPLPLFSDPLQSPDTPDITPPSSPHQRRRSNLFQPTTSALGAASDAVRSTADQGLKNIGSTLDHSFKFLFGRLREQNVNREGKDSTGTVLLPKTLEDARRLVDPKPLLDEEGTASGASSIAEKPDIHNEAGSKADDRLLGVFAGRKQQHRDRSVDSIQSSGSGSKKVAFITNADEIKEKPASSGKLSDPPPTQEQSVTAPNAAVESMRNLGISLNPLNRLGGLSVMRGFGRNSSGTTPTLDTASPTIDVTSSEATKTSNSISMQPPPVPPKIAPPIKKFIDTIDAGDLRVSEIAELLKDYKRLVDALKADGKL